MSTSSKNPNSKNCYQGLIKGTRSSGSNLQEPRTRHIIICVCLHANEPSHMTHILSLTCMRCVFLSFRILKPGAYCAPKYGPAFTLKVLKRGLKKGGKRLERFTKNFLCSFSFFLSRLSSLLSLAYQSPSSETRKKAPEAKKNEYKKYQTAALLRARTRRQIGGVSEILGSGNHFCAQIHDEIDIGDPKQRRSQEI